VLDPGGVRSRKASRQRTRDRAAESGRADELARPARGGQILVPVTDVGEMVGGIGFFVDSEGNRIGVHRSPQM
jgi:hypothetical protein